MEEIVSKEFDPWVVDAANWDDSAFAEISACGGREILRFCMQSSSERKIAQELNPLKCVLAGERGFGKSFLLGCRSHNHRALCSQSVFFHPFGGRGRRLVERLTSLSKAIPENHSLRSADAAEDWSYIWQVAIIGLFLWRLADSPEEVGSFLEAFPQVQRIRRDIYEAFEEAIDENSDFPRAPLQWFLVQVVEGLALCSRKETSKKIAAMHYAAMNEWSMLVLARLKQSSRQSLALYIDNPDELISMTEGHVWVNVQQGLLLAIWKLRRGGVLNSHLEMYASVRAEAIAGQTGIATHPDLVLAKDHVLTLAYDKSALEKLFRQRVRLTSSDALVFPELIDSDLEKSFFGFREYDHIDRFSPDGRPISENVIDAVIRHCRLVPRDIVCMGRAISSVRPANRNQHAVRDQINLESIEIVEYVKRNAFPIWGSPLESLLGKCSGPICSVDELRSMLGESFELDESIGRLRALGLLGGLDSIALRHAHCFVQRFRTQSGVVGSNPASGFLVVHPMTKEWIRKNAKTANWRDTYGQLVGDGLQFELRKPSIRILLSVDSVVVDLGGHLVVKDYSATTDKIWFMIFVLLSWRDIGGARRITSNDLLRNVDRVLEKRLALGSGAWQALRLRWKETLCDQDHVRDWCKKIAREKGKYFPANSVLRSAAPEGLGGGRRNGGLITVSCFAGCLPTFSLPTIDHGEIDVVDYRAS